MQSAFRTVARNLGALTSAAIMLGAATAARADETAPPNNLPISQNGNFNLSNKQGSLHINFVCSVNGKQSIVQMTNLVHGGGEGSSRSTLYVSTLGQGDNDGGSSNRGFSMSIRDVLYDTSQTITHFDSGANGAVRYDAKGNPVDIAAIPTAAHMTLDNSAQRLGVDRDATRTNKEAEMVHLAEGRAQLAAEIVALNCTGDMPNMRSVIPDPEYRNHAWVQDGNWREEIWTSPRNADQPISGSIAGDNAKTHVSFQANSDNLFGAFLWGRPFQNLGNFTLFDGTNTVTNFNEPGSGYTGRVIETNPGRFNDYDNGKPTERSLAYMWRAQLALDAVRPALQSTGGGILGFLGYFPDGDPRALGRQPPSTPETKPAGKPAATPSGDSAAAPAAVQSAPLPPIEAGSAAPTVPSEPTTRNPFKNGKTDVCSTLGRLASCPKP